MGKGSGDGSETGSVMEKKTTSLLHEYFTSIFMNGPTGLLFKLTTHCNLAVMPLYLSLMFNVQLPHNLMV